MEKWNAYTRDGKLTEQVLIRGEAVPEGLYHLVCEVLVRHADGSYLCTKRASCKEVYPGVYEASAGGSALWGEDKFQCIKRELREETGISCDEFQEVGRCVQEDSSSIFYSFVCTVDCDKEAVTLQEGETEDYRWLSENEFIRYVNSDEGIDRQKERYYNYFISKGYLEEGHDHDF